MAFDPIHLPVYYDQGAASAPMYFLVRVENGAPGSEVAFRALVPNPAGPIELPTTKLPAATGVVGIEAFVEAGYRSEIIVTYWPGGPLPPGFAIAFEALYAAPAQAPAAAPDGAGEVIVKEVQYDQGDQAATVEFFLVVRHGTPGAVVALTSANPLPTGPLVIPPTTVPNGNFMVGVEAPVPANWQSLITCTYDPRGTAVHPDLEFDLRAVVIAPAVAAEASDPIVSQVGYAQGPEGGRMAFMLDVRNGTPGATVAFHATTPNGGGAPIALPPTRVVRPDFVTGIAADVEAGYETRIVYSYDPNGTAVSPDLSLGMSVFFIPGTVAPAQDDTSGDDEEPKLVLNVALQNPMINDTAQVGVSFETGAPVLNTLDLLIQNPSDQPLINFENVDELGPDDPIPPIDEPYKGPRLDRLYVYFPYGSTQGTLTSRDLAAAITLSPGSKNSTWDVVQQSNPQIGTYWILFPRKQVVLGPTESVAFRFTGIKTFNPAPSLTHLRMKKQVTGYEVETDTTTMLSLVDAQPKIITFGMSQDNVPAGTTVNFFWTTWGAKNCTFAGQAGLDASVTAYPVRVLVTDTYRLEAISASSRTAFDQRTVHVLPVQIKSFTAQPPQGSRRGEAVVLEWSTASAVTLDIQPDVGVVCDEAAGCDHGRATVYPVTRTVYTLTATGGTSSLKATVTVFPLPRGWAMTTDAAPWSTTGKPVLFGFREQLVFVAGGAPGIYTSLDGATWRTIGSNAPWGNRTFAGGVVFNAGDGEKMWLMGGQDGSAVSAEVYASAAPEASAWTKVTDSPGWPSRSNFGCIVYAGKIWVIGGSNGKGGGYNDVWTSSNGIDWTRVIEHAPWSPRWAFGLAAFQNRLWIFGGQTGPNDGDVDNEIWSSADGVTWKKWPMPDWNPRSYANAQTFTDRVFLFGGARTSNVAFSDLWRMTIKVESGQEILIWTQQAGIDMRNSAAMASTMFAGGAWLAGGWSAPQSVPGPNKRVWLYAPIPL